MVLCIVAAIPLLVAACMDAPDVVCTSFVSLLLILVACGVYMIIRVGMIKGSYDILLQEGDYTISEKKLKKKLSEYLKRGKAVARPLAVTIKRVNEIVRGWINYFRIQDWMYG